MMNDFTRLMLDHCPEMLFLVNPVSLKIEIANATAVKILGYDAEELLGFTITEVESALPDVFYWDEVRNGQYLEVEDQESQYRRRNGDLLDVRKSIQLVEHGGVSMLFVRTVTTQSEHIAQDALASTLSQLRATLESTSNGILVIDWRGKIDSMNRLFGKMWAIPEDYMYWQDDAKIMEFLALNVQESELFRDRLRAIVDTSETLDLLHHIDGRVFEMSSRPQYLAVQIIGRVFVFQDVTLHIQAELALREARDRLEEGVLARTADLYAVNETLKQEKESQATLIKKLEETQNQLLQSERMASIGQLAAGVAHEINNPVGFVNSNLGSLQRYVTDLLHLLSTYEQTEESMAGPVLQAIRQVKEDIDIVFLRTDVTQLLAESLDGIKRVTRIVQDLKSFSHVDEAELQWADLEAGLESTLRVVWNELKYKAEVVKEFAGIVRIECFPFQLNQVFMNLLINASHALETRGTITVRTGQDETQVWVEVADTGKGIPRHVLPRIFDPFFTTKPVGQGTGLGLSLSYAIVQKHHGRIDVQSEVGKGSTFRVTLPIRESGAPAAGAPQMA